MFSWLTGTADAPKPAEAQAPGFHPIALPATTPASSPLTMTAHATPAVPSAPTMTTTTTSTSSGSAPPAVVPPQETSSSFLFDGMAVARSRRRRPGAVEQTSSSAAATASSTTTAAATPPQHEDDHPQRAQAEGSSASSTVNFVKNETPSATASPELRQRLERFYRIYNPAKLAQVEVILEAYRGREAELFSELMERYGPEPVPLSPTQLTHAGKGASGPTAAASESEGSAFRFISPTAEAAVAAWAVPPAEEIEEDKRAVESETPALPVQPPPEPLVEPSARSEEAGAPPNPPAPSPSTADTPSPVAAVAPPSPPPSTTTEEEEEENETVEERHRRELRVSQGALLEARAELAAVLREAREALQARHDSVSSIHALEAQIQACVQAERFRDADALSDDVHAAALTVRRCDGVWAVLGRRVATAQRELEEAVRGVAAVLRAHEAELSAEADRDACAARQQRSHDDADLRLREETVKVRQEDLAVRRAAAEARVRAAQEAQAAVRQRVASAVSATRTRKDELAGEVAELDARIDALRQQLRRLEERQAAAQTQLQAATAQLAAAEAHHAGELHDAASAVESCAGEAQRVAQLCEDAAADEAQIAAERAEREAVAAELRRAQQDREAERDAVHLRTRALEQQTITASDRYWRAWQNVLSSRERGADVLFEVPAATHPEETARGAPSALTRKTDLLKQLEELATEATADDALRREAQRRVDACDERIAPLSAAKAAAVASRNFKAAQQLVDELKVLQLRRESCQGDVDLYDGQVRALERTMGRLREELAKVEAETQRCAADFRRDYAVVMREFEAIAADTPDYLQLPKSSQGEDELAAAAAALWAALQQEWRGTAAHADAAAGGDRRAVASDECAHAPSVVGEGEEGAESDAGGDGTREVAAEITATGPGASPAEDTQHRLAVLRDQLEEAIAAEAFDKCDRIQSSIDELEAQQLLASGG